MSIGLRFFRDPGLTQRISRLDAVQSSDGSAPVFESVFYVGAALPGYRYRNAANPGTAPITLSVLDSGTGAPASSVRLALDAAALDAAVPGAALALPPDLLGGADGAIEVFIRIDTGATAAGAYDNLSIVTDDIREEVL